MSGGFLRLGVNIDHVATLRQARYAGAHHTSPGAEPSPLEAAKACIGAGAHSITMHLREDRRHVQDDDVWQVRREVEAPLNLELGNTPEIVGIALEVAPRYACLVPEKREEVTTEGGLDAAGQVDALRPTVARLRDAGVEVSLFVDPEVRQVEAAAELGAPTIELHTGAFANAVGDARRREVDNLVEAARAAHALGVQVNAGHGLTTANLPELFRVPHLVELNIGHHIVSRAVFTGLGESVREMLEAMSAYGRLSCP